MPEREIEVAPHVCGRCGATTQALTFVPDPTAPIRGTRIGVCDACVTATAAA